MLAGAVGETPITLASRPHTFQRTTNNEQSADPTILQPIDALTQHDIIKPPSNFIL
jgi:hypothetical protein